MSEISANEGLITEGAQFEAAALELLKVLEPGFERIELTMAEAGPVRSAQVVAFRSDGSEKSYRGVSAVTDAAALLRKRMYRDGAGTWWETRITVTAEGTAEGSYNYDREPDWGWDVSAQVYVDDLKAFPRTEENIPAWLTEKLAAPDT